MVMVRDGHELARLEYVFDYGIALGLAKWSSLDTTSYSTCINTAQRN